MLSALLLAVLALLAPPRDERPLAASPAPHDSLPAIDVNDNRAPAGSLRDGVLEVRLVAREGRWYPEGLDGPMIPIQAFGEDDGPLLNPGPLIRVPAGTTIRATIRNAIADSTLTVYGLHERPGSPEDSLQIAPGATRTVEFPAGAPGTYFYWATTSGKKIIERYQDDGQLHGALVVDPPGAPAEPVDRIFVIGLWFQDADTTSPVPIEERGTMVINGRPWPHTERLTFTVGDTVRWRWINATDTPHPMHLHGFYFRVDARGDWAQDTLYADDRRRLAVTERLLPGTTMAATWVPERPGNWIFHCHFAFHVSHFLWLGKPAVDPDAEPGAEPDAAPDHATHRMSGLVLGLHVLPKESGVETVLAENVPELPPPRRLRLLIQADPDRWGEMGAGYGYLLEDPAVPAAATPPPDSIQVPGPTIVLRRGEPVAITIVNHLPEPTAVHWHGIELESFPDGVPGWSGQPGRIMPAIAPGDSFVAEFVPPRAGTFMYHAHSNELEQIHRGLYGPLLVVDAAAPRDETKEHVLMLSWDASVKEVVREDLRPLLNGRRDPAPLELEAGVPHRLRFMGIFTNGGQLVRLRDGETLQSWRPVAKDGADLPPGQAVPRPAAQRIVAGETYDFEVTPQAGGNLVLEIGTPEAIHLTVPVRVR